MFFCGALNRLNFNFWLFCLRHIDSNNCSTDSNGPVVIYTFLCSFSLALAFSGSLHLSANNCFPGITSIALPPPNRENIVVNILSANSQRTRKLDANKLSKRYWVSKIRSLLTHRMNYSCTIYLHQTRRKTENNKIYHSIFWVFWPKSILACDLRKWDKHV